MSSNAFTVAAQMSAAGVAADVALASTVGRYAQLGLAKVRANASGRPGPRAVTGNYRRSISVERVSPMEASIGTNAPQGARLEYGFVGADSLGRHYNSPAFPHFGPMTDWLEPQFAAAILTALGGLF